MRSAWAMVVESPLAISLVMCWPPSGMTSAKTRLPSKKMANGGGGATHVDDGDAKLQLVVGENRAGRRIRRYDEAGGRQVRALDGEGEILQMRGLDGDDAELEAKCCAEHAERGFDTFHVVELILDGREVENAAAAGIDLRQARPFRTFSMSRMLTWPCWVCSLA